MHFTGGSKDDVPGTDLNYITARAVRLLSDALESGLDHTDPVKVVAGFRFHCCCSVRVCCINPPWPLATLPGENICPDPHSLR